MNTEPSHDPWLREALRHAPDAGDAPPPALSEAILREARAKAAPPPRGRALERWWHWFAQPSVAGALASVMVAIVLTVMWRERSFDEDEVARTRPTAQAPAQEPAPLADAPARAADASTPPAPAQRQEKAAAPRRAAPAAQTQTPAPAAVPAAPPAAERRAETAARPEPRSRDALGKLEAAAPAAAPAAAAFDPLPPIATGTAARWSVAGRSRPHGDAQQAWLDRLRSTTAGRWRQVDNVSRDGTPVQLFQGTRQTGEFVLASDHVLWLDPTRGAWRASLTEPEAAQFEALARQW